MEDVDRCSLKTAQKKQENLKQRETLCTHVIKFSSLKDFPKQIRIKRKYLKSRDDDVREKLRKIEFCADVRSTPKILPDARRRKET